MRRIHTIYIYILLLLLSSFSDHKNTLDIKKNKEKNDHISYNNDDKSEKIFIKNNGQWHKDILFSAKLNYGEIFVRKKGLTFVQVDKSHFEENGHYHGDGKVNGVRIDLDFENNNAEKLKIHTSKKSIAVYNYIDNKGSTISAHAYSEIYVSNMYKNIDWRIYTTIYGSIKHEFILKPNAEPDQIKMLAKGHNSLKVVDNQLHIITDYMPIIEKEPETYYARTNKKIPVKYHINDDVISFKFLSRYNKNQTAVIDPELIFSTYTGSASNNWGFTATYGEEGTAYTAGIVFGVGFPVTTGTFQLNFVGYIDIGIMKLSEDGSTLLHATYLGGNNIDIPHSLLLDKDNNLLVFGTTSSTDFPTTYGAYQNSLKTTESSFFNRTNTFVELNIPFDRSTDIFISRLSSNGRKLLHSTLVGGSNTDGINSFITGVDSRFVATRIRELSYSYGDSFRGDLAQDSNGDIYVVSTTKSNDFPVTTNAYQSTYGGGTSDAVMLKLDESLSQLKWSTYLGGNKGDNFFNMKIGNDGNLIVCGNTLSKDSFLPSAGRYKPTINMGKSSNGITPTGVVDIADGFIAKVNADTGIVTDATYVGTSGYDLAYFVDTDSNNDIFTIGITLSDDFPKSPNTYGNTNGGVFIQKLSSDLTQSILSTRIGNALPSISPTAFLVNSCDDIYLTGFANQKLFTRFSLSQSISLTTVEYVGSTAGLPTTDDAFQKTTNGRDFYLMILGKNFEKLVYGTFFGGTGGGINEHVDGGTNRFDKNGVVYHTVCANCNNSNTFPVTQNAYSTRSRAEQCNNAVFKFNFFKLKADFKIRARDNDIANNSTVCTPFTLDIINNTEGSTTNYLWNLGDGTTVTKTNKESFSYTYQNPGQYIIKMTARTDDSCAGISEKTFTINVVNSNVTHVQNRTICQNEEFQLWVNNVNNAAWKIKGGNNISNTSTATVKPTSTTTYAVTGTSNIGQCSIYEEVTVTVIPDVVANMNYYNTADDNVNSNIICTSLPTIITFKNISENAESYIWNFGDGTTSNTNDKNDITHTYNQQGEYIIALTAISNTACNKKHTTTKTVKVGNTISILDTPPVLVCLGDTHSLFVDENITNIKWYIDGIQQSNLISTDRKVIIAPKENTTYYLVGQTTFGCPYIKKYTVNINEINNIQFRIKPNTTCLSPLTVQLEAYIQNPDGEKTIDTTNTEITFNLDDKTTYNNTEVTHTYTNQGVYNIKMTAKTQSCFIERAMQIEMPNIELPNVITPNGDNKNDTFVILGKHKIKLALFDRWGRKIYEDDDYKNNWPQPNSKHKGVINYEATIKGGDKCNGWFEVK